MAINMALATLIGTFTPFAMKKMNIDPAVASGPVIATAIDVLGLAVYFSLATFYVVKFMQNVQNFEQVKILSGFKNTNLLMLTIVTKINLIIKVFERMCRHA